MALIPKHYLDAVAVLEQEDARGDGESFHVVATGTLLGYSTDDQSAHHVVLVTNRHVVEGQEELLIRFNQGAGSERFRLALRNQNGEASFLQSSRFDVAVLPIRVDLLKTAGAEFDVIPEAAFLDMDGLEEEGVVSGDGIYVLGFPMGIAGEQRKYAVVRGGVIARLDRDIVRETDTFLLDCPVFPGNSGGPVILKPEPIALTGTSGRNRTHLIGIVSGYVPYEDVAISAQSQQPRVWFQENSGLTNAVPLDAVHELVRPIVQRQQELAEADSAQTSQGQD